jgi:hypothetical protein
MSMNPKPCPGLRPPGSFCPNMMYPKTVGGITIQPLRCDSCEELVKSFLALMEEEAIG